MRKILLLLVFALLLMGCAQKIDDAIKEKHSGIATLILKYEGNTEIKSYNFNDITAYDLLKMKHIVEVEDSRIRCINELCSTDGYNWAFYVNREKINASPITFKIRNNDVVEFGFE